MPTTLQAYEKALDDLIMGQSVTQVRTANGKTLTFAQADKKGLESKIAQLKRQNRRHRTRTRQVFTSKGL